VDTRKLFRQCFTTVDPEAKPVIAKRGNFTGAIGPEHFPGQTLAPDLEPVALDAIFGIYQEIPGNKSKAMPCEPDAVLNPYLPMNINGKKSRAVQYEPDPALRDYENVPLKEDIVSFFLREVRPFVPDAWIDRDTVDEKDGGIGKIGYEINFNRIFFRYQPPRLLDEIDAELDQVEKRILTLLKEVTA
jgi:type I restriction enzyme M protein